MSVVRLALRSSVVFAACCVGAWSQTNPPDVPKVDVPRTGPLPNSIVQLARVTSSDLLQPAGQQWVNYHGDYSGRHHAAVDQINRRNVSQLQRVWVSETNPQMRPGGRVGGPAATARAAPTGPGRTGSGGGLAGMFAVRSVPLFHDGVLFYTLGSNAYALDARTGRQIWHYIANSSGGLSNRGLAISGDTLYMMANGGLTALDARSGAEKWRRNIGGPVAANAPMIVRDHVYVVAGSDGGTGRSWLESRNAITGEREWIWHVSPFPGQPGAETWPSAAAMAMGGGTPWQPLTYDPELNLIYFGTGNPFPMKDGRTRVGDNLYTCSIVALDADTGKLVWHFQMTPHDDHDYDGNQVTMLFDRQIKGQGRKLLGLIGRGGFVFVLDRVTGENLVSERIFPEINWTRHLRPNGTPEPDMHKSPTAGGVLVFPGSEGITNFPASAYSPQSGLMYSNVVRSWSLFYTSGEYFLGDFRNSLRAFDAESGRTVWAHEYPEPYGIHARYPGVLSTAGELIFTGDVSGNVVAFDARDGKILWHDELPSAPVGNAPMSFVLDGRQHVVIASGEQLFAYALPVAALRTTQ
jgi:PQQ-dependent dehydrogenase (methanol/ethanol family)